MNNTYLLFKTSNSWIEVHDEHSDDSKTK